MKNNLYILIIVILFFKPLMAENLSIESSSISIDKKQKISIFKGDVSVIDEKKK